MFLDSGASGNFISKQLCHLLDIPRIPLTQNLPITSILGKPLGWGYISYKIPPIKVQVGVLHLEQIHFLVLEGSTMDIVFGYPWLCKHSPVLSWHTGEIMKWSFQNLHGSHPAADIPQGKDPVTRTSGEYVHHLN